MPRLNALVIGNADYDHGCKLKNPTNDADDIAKVLTDGGFNVTKLTNATFKEMKKALKVFEKAADDGGAVSVFFFAGHGVEVDGVNYLIAKDTEADDKTDVETGALSLNEVIIRMEPKDGATRTSIIVLDACRDNPFERKWRGKPRGLAPVYAPRGTLVAFATSPGQFASDGTGRNGLYTEALLKHIEEPDLPVEAMFKRVRNTLGAATKQKQISWEHTSLAGEFYFHLSAAASIENYSATAIKDRTFVLDESKLSHRTIRSLKSYSWYTQNPALEKLTGEKINGASADTLFVLGRNILQAADGSANAAIGWIRGFRAHARGMNSTKRKAILDGILFEIFFDSQGEPRKRMKINFFNDVFDLEQYPEFSDSFDFIASALANQAHRMFAIPGKGHTVTVDVQLDDDNIIGGVFFGGTNFLRQEDDSFDLGDNERIYQTLKCEDLENVLSQQMLVPKRLLKAIYSKPVGPSDKVKLSYGAEVRRPL
jgi:Caspase domain